jgi:hypothetical protein
MGHWSHRQLLRDVEAEPARLIGLPAVQSGSGTATGHRPRTVVREIRQQPERLLRWDGGPRPAAGWSGPPGWRREEQRASAKANGPGTSVEIRDVRYNVSREEEVWIYRSSLSSFERAVAVATALISIVRRPWDSSSATAAIAVPPGVVTSSRRIAGCLPESMTTWPRRDRLRRQPERSAAGSLLHASVVNASTNM